MKSKVCILLLMFVMFFISCDKKEYEVVNIATPVYMTKEEFKSSVKITAPQETIQSGKIYVYGDLILINDVDKGIHVIDNSNPLEPKKKVFIEIVGNEDMEIKGDYLYADSLMDLVVFDISDLDNITEVTRIDDVLLNYVCLLYTSDAADD